MRLIMLGTGPFAVPTFRSLVAAGHEVPLLVTRPTRQAEGRSAAAPSPMRLAAEELGIRVLAPETVNDDAIRAELRSLSPELLVVCDYGEILRPASLQVATLGGINLHASLLPKYRGAAPINWAIYNGDPETGNTVIHMTPQLDAGPTLAQSRTPIGPRETAVELEARLAGLGAELVLQVIADLAAGRARPIIQEPAQATKAPRLKKTDGLLNWNRTASELFNQLRAFQPWPQLYTFWNRPEKEPLRILIHQAEVVPAEEVAKIAGSASQPDILSQSGISPGTVLAVGEQLLVSTGDGALRLLSLQPAGKKAMDAQSFLRGYQLSPGDHLG